jgi:predicted flap endonuclease-1-like 5' DNA nuclease
MRVKGIGEKRAAQLEALGINSLSQLASVSAEDLARDLKISPKITAKWVTSAKDLAK